MMTAAPTVGGLPQSAALSEASPDSLSELFSRDPEHLSEQDLDRIIEELRKRREVWAAAESNTSRKPRTTAFAGTVKGSDLF